jgi:hypothetical protein
MELFKTADEKSSWVRVPVVNYLRACPLPRAKELLKECEKIDPAAYKRATTWFPQTPAAGAAPTPEKASSIETPGAVRPVAATEAPLVAPVGAEVAAAGGVPTVPADDELAAGEDLSINQGAAPAAAIKQEATPPPNLWLVLGVPWVVGLSILAAQWTVLRCRI